MCTHTDMQSLKLIQEKISYYLQKRFVNFKIALKNSIEISKLFQIKMV